MAALRATRIGALFTSSGLDPPTPLPSGEAVPREAQGRTVEVLPAASSRRANQRQWVSGA
jgi:hypothetical protein